MIELNRKIYMTDDYQKSDNYQNVKNMCGELIAKITERT